MLSSTNVWERLRRARSHLARVKADTGYYLVWGFALLFFVLGVITRQLILWVLIIPAAYIFRVLQIAHLNKIAKAQREVLRLEQLMRDLSR